MNNKIIIALLSILSVFFILCGIYGFFLNNNKIDNPIIENKIKYKYFLENKEVNEMPNNIFKTNEDGTTTQEIKYIFKKYTCSNDTKIIFNKDNWNFITEGDKNGICELHFSKASYKVDINLTNAIQDENNINEIPRETNANFKIIPNEGYIFKDVSCSNNKDATWNEKTNILTINAILQDLECSVNFEKKQLQINIIVKNGIGNTTENVFYADNKSIIVQPNKGYKDASISCTNKQTATFDNNTIIFDKITNNTTCTITYKKETNIYYNLSIENEIDPSNIILITENKQSIKNGENGKIILKSTNGIIPKLNCGDIIPTTKELDENETIKTIEYTFYNITNNISCKITN